MNNFYVFVQDITGEYPFKEVIKAIDIKDAREKAKTKYGNNGVVVWNERKYRFLFDDYKEEK